MKSGVNNRCANCTSRIKFMNRADHECGRNMLVRQKRPGDQRRVRAESRRNKQRLQHSDILVLEIILVLVLVVLV